jgi:molecular chaperone GrpE
VEKKKENSSSINDLENTDASESGSGTAMDNELELTLAAKSDEVKNLNDKYLRLAAEFENYKRLAQRDQREQVKFANENVLRELLPVVDNLHRAVTFSKSPSGSNKLVEGVELTLKQFIESLSKFGVKQITSVGELFDPARHQAVASVESKDKPEHTVVEEHQSGYLLHDRILRPAMVTVAAAAREEGEHHG